MFDQIFTTLYTAVPGTVGFDRDTQFDELQSKRDFPNGKQKFLRKQVSLSGIVIVIVIIRHRHRHHRRQGQPKILASAQRVDGYFQCQRYNVIVSVALTASGSASTSLSASASLDLLYHVSYLCCFLCPFSVNTDHTQNNHVYQYFRFNTSSVILHLSCWAIVLFL